MTRQPNPLPSLEFVSPLLDYNADTGIFHWKTDRGFSPRAGNVAGCKKKSGYVVIQVSGTAYPAHRLAWLLSFGVAPPDEIDHVNGDKADNRLANLRLASRAENTRNVGIKRTNTSGVKGVGFHFQSGKWRARIHAGGKRIHLGLFSDQASAHAALEAARQQYHGEFSHA